MTATTTTTVALPTGTYQIDPIHSTIGFALRFNGLSMFRSTFSGMSGTLADGQLTGSVDVETLNIKMPRFREHLLTADFFWIDRYPTADFTSTAITLTDTGDITFEGDLTIRGATRPVVGVGTFAAAEDAFGNDRIGMTVRASIDRRDFGFTWQNPLPNGGDSLAWKAELTADVQMVKPHDD